MTFDLNIRHARLLCHCQFHRSVSQVNRCPPVNSPQTLRAVAKKKQKNRLCSEFGTSFQAEVALFLDIAKFPYNTV